MRKAGSEMTDNQIVSLLVEAKPDFRIPPAADFRIHEMIKANTADYVPATGKLYSLRSFRRVALPAAAAFLFAAGLSIFFATDLFKPGVAPKLAWGQILSSDGSVNTEMNGMINPAIIGSAITEKSFITTGPSSSCLVLLQDGSKLFVGENSKIHFKRLLKGSSFTARILLEQGEVSAKVNKISRGSEFAIRSGLLKAEVHGTEFMVHSVEGEQYVAVLDGAVKVSRNDEKVSVMAHGMEKASVDGKGIATTTISDSDAKFVKRAFGNDFTSDVELVALGGADPAAEDIKSSIKELSAQSVASEIAVESPKHTIYSLLVDAKSEWVDSRITVQNGDIIEVVANGSVTTSKNGAPVGPNGEDTESSEDRLSSTAPLGSLVMSSDGGKNVIYIGSKDKYRVTSAGRLLFSVNDKEGGFKDNSGAFTVKVTIKRK